jgi:hypothetical protein
MPTDPIPTWEDVLDECEQAAAEAEALVRSRPGEPAIDVGASWLNLWQLNLPPLPADLMPRAQRVHSRHLQLQAAIVVAMHQLAQQDRLASNGVEKTARQSYYFDKSA